MKTDDERLEKTRTEMFERVERIDALTLAVIKGHLLIEQTMDAFLEASLPHPGYILGRLMFANKSYLCRSMSFDESGDKAWIVLSAVNALRNDIVHEMDPGDIKKGMDSLRTIFLGILTPEQAKGLKGQPDQYIAQSACVHCAGFLATLAEDAKARRRVTDEHWKPRG
jgi:hypothetical protein